MKCVTFIIAIIFQQLPSTYGDFVGPNSLFETPQY